MRHRRPHVRWWSLVLVTTWLGLVISGCGPLQRAQSDTPTPLGLGAAPPPSTTPVPATATSPPTPASATPTASATRDPLATSVATGQRFRIDARSKSSDSSLSRVELVLRSAELSDDRLVLRVAFQNTTTESFMLIGSVSALDAVLEDADGQSYSPVDVSDNLRIGIDPQGGFGPGAANVGDIIFERPSGDEPYELRFPFFEPITFRLDTPLPEAAQAPIAPGSYQLDVELRSSEEALQPIALRVRSLQVSDASVTFEVAFVNTARQGYDLLFGPQGKDARLLDAEGSQYQPTAVSDSLAQSIAPAQGWAPGAEHVGTITFARPTASQELRFIFPSYDALTVRTDAGGKPAAQVTSPTGGAPLPTPLPSTADQTFDALTALLENQAQAVINGDSDRYLATFTPLLRSEHQQIIERIRQMGVISYTLQLAPDASLPEEATSAIDDVPVEVGYALSGIAPDNSFHHQLRYSFERDGDGWVVSRVVPDEHPPFWLTGDVTRHATEHFLILARPEAAAELPILEQETEAAYAALAERGLPLEERYVAYFTSSQDDFGELTGQYSMRVLGVALSRYDLSGTTIQVDSRAFYINGEAFTDQQNGPSEADRQTTITHELVHLALATQTRPYTPPWLAEGVAVYYSEGRNAELRTHVLDSGQLERLNLAQLTRAGSLGEHDILGEQTGYEYIFSGETVAYLIETYGEQRLFDFYRSYADVPASDVHDRMPRFGSAFVADAVFADLRVQLTEAALQRFFNTTLAQLEADVKAWLRAP